MYGWMTVRIDKWKSNGRTDGCTEEDWMERWTGVGVSWVYQWMDDWETVGVKD